MKFKPVILCALLSGLLGAGLLLGFLSLPAQAAPSAILQVCLSGCAYETIQMAVDAASGGDTIQVAGDVYSGVSPTGGYTQVVYIDKALTIIGGYNQAFTEHNPELYPTIVDAKGQGRVFYITGMTGTQITLADLSITGGDASRMQVSQSASGGGVFVTGASLTISNSLIFANVIGPIGGSYSYGYGGGVYAADASLRILNSQVYNNLANVNSSGYGHGGGLYATDSLLEIAQSEVYSNTAAAGASGSTGYGGGIFIDGGDSNMTATYIHGNTASTSSSGWGGGVYLSAWQAMLDGNWIQRNTASAGTGTTDLGYGGGIYVTPPAASHKTLLASGVTIQNTSLHWNIAAAGLGAYGYGGGIAIQGGSPLIAHNGVFYNKAALQGPGWGGGIYSGGADAQIVGNRVMGNLATQTSASQGYGGGIQLSYDASQLINNTVVNNRSGLGAMYSQGDGIDIQNSSLTTLLHNTIYDNKSGDYTGVYVDRFSAVSLINTILVSQTTGLYADADMYDSAYVTMTGVLWTPSMITPVSGGGYVTVTNEVIGYPRFANQGYEYEITLFSAARNAGVPIDTGLYPLAAQDIEGDPRPYPALGAPDLGADELKLVSAVLTQKDGGQLDCSDIPEMAIRVNVPPDAVNMLTLLACQVLDTPPGEPLPPGQLFAGRSFTLDAYRDMQWLNGFQFDRPVEVTVYYRDEDILGIDEASLRLYYWDEDTLAWVDGAETCSPTSAYTRDPLNNFISLPICHLSRWDMHGVAPGSGFQVYLPVAAKAP